eukprot:6488672-Amphidinium_carterae.1
MNYLVYYLNVVYAVHMYKDIYKQCREKNMRAHENKFVKFVIHYYGDKAAQLMTQAGCTTREINKAYEHHNQVATTEFEANYRQHLQLPTHNERLGDEEDEDDEGQDESSRGTTRASDTEHYRPKYLGFGNGGKSRRPSINN